MIKPNDISLFDNAADISIAMIGTKWTQPPVYKGGYLRISYSALVGCPVLKYQATGDMRHLNESLYSGNDAVFKTGEFTFSLPGSGSHTIKVRPGDRCFVTHHVCQPTGHIALILELELRESGKVVHMYDASSLLHAIYSEV